MRVGWFEAVGVDEHIDARRGEAIADEFLAHVATRAVLAVLEADPGDRLALALAGLGRALSR